MRREWLDAVIADVREHVDPMYQNTVISACEKQVDMQPRAIRNIYGSGKGRVKTYICTHCGFELSEVYWKFCPNCGVPLPTDWANKAVKDGN